MNKIYTLTTFVILLMACSVLAGVGDLGHAWVNPVTSNIVYGGGDQTFEITIQANSSENAPYAGITLGYDPSVVSVTLDDVSLAEGLIYLPSAPLTIEDGVISFGVQKGGLAPMNTPNEVFDLATISFSIVEEGIMTLSLNVLNLNGVSVSDIGGVQIITACVPVCDQGTSYCVGETYDDSCGGTCDGTLPPFCPSVEQVVCGNPVNSMNDCEGCEGVGTNCLNGGTCVAGVCEAVETIISVSGLQSGVLQAIEDDAPLIEVASQLKVFFASGSDTAGTYAVVNENKAPLLTAVAGILNDPGKNKLQKVSLIAYQLMLQNA